MVWSCVDRELVCLAGGGNRSSDCGSVSHHALVFHALRAAGHRWRSGAPLFLSDFCNFVHRSDPPSHGHLCRHFFGGAHHSEIFSILHRNSRRDSGPFPCLVSTGHFAISRHTPNAAVFFSEQLGLVRMAGPARALRRFARLCKACGPLLPRSYAASLPIPRHLWSFVHGRSGIHRAPGEAGGNPATALPAFAIRVDVSFCRRTYRQVSAEKIFLALGASFPTAVRRNGLFAGPAYSRFAAFRGSWPPVAKRLGTGLQMGTS